MLFERNCGMMTECLKARRVMTWLQENTFQTEHGSIGYPAAIDTPAC